MLDFSESTTVYLAFGCTDLRKSTSVQVIDEPDQKGSTQNWMWVYLTDE